MLTKIQLTPGIKKETTQYANAGGWWSSNFIRFRHGLPEKIGGWQKVYTNQTALLGVCRRLFDWSSLTGLTLLAAPTNYKFYVDNTSGFLDITPTRRTVTLGASPIATVNTSAIITITDVNHGAQVGNYINITGASNTNGILSTKINTEFPIVSVVNANAYTVLTTGTASSTGSGGGSSVVVNYQFFPGTPTTFNFSGWGAGGWGGTSTPPGYGWGSGPNTTVTTYYSGLWTVSNYGQDLVACPRNLTNGMYLGSNALTTSNTSNTVTVTQVNHGFVNNQSIIIGGVTDSSVGGIPNTDLAGSHIITVSNANAYTYITTTTATSTASGGGASMYAFLSSLIYWAYGTTNAVSFSNLGTAYAKKYLPYVAVEIAVSPLNRQVLAFGCNPYDVTKGQDQMNIRWSDSSDPTNWDAADTTKNAGEQRLSSGAYIITQVQSNQEILVWTDNALYVMSYVGPPSGWGFQLVGTNFDLIGPNAKIVTGAVAYWMGVNNFYSYNGSIAPLPCDLRDYVFLDLDKTNGNKVYCSADSGNNEIIWFYPSISGGTGDVDKCVVYNFVENVWYPHTLARTAWIDRRGHPYPRAMSTDSYLYYHENGYDDGSASPATPINSYIESSPLEIHNGQSYSFVNRIVPDINFRNSTSQGMTQPFVNFTIKPQNYPGDAVGAGTPEPITRSSTATLTVNTFTEQLFTRIRARSITLRIDSTALGVAWRLGVPRFDIRQDGRK